MGKKLLYILLLAESLVLMASCRQTNTGELPPGYSGQLFQHYLDAQPVHRTAEVLRQADSGIALKPDNYRLKAVGYHIYLHHHEYTTRNWDLLERYADSILDLRKHIFPALIKREVLGAIHAKATAAIARNEYLLAYRHIFDGIQMARELGDSCYDLQFYQTLGSLAFGQDKFRNSINYYRKAYQRLGYCDRSVNGDERFIARATSLFNNIGVAYERLQLTDSALVNYRIADSLVTLNLAIRPQDPSLAISRAVVRGNMGYLLGLQGHFAEGEKLLLSSYPVTRHGQDSMDAFLSMIKLADLYTLQNKLPQAEKLIRELDPVFETLHEVTPTLRFLKLKTQFYTLQGKQELALSTFRRYIAFGDSIRNNRAANRSIHIERELESLQSYELLTNLQKEKTTDNRLIFLLISGVSISLFLLLVTIRNSIGKRRQNILLKQLHHKMSQQTKKLEQQAEEKDRIMKVLVHDIRSPINSLSGLAALISSTRDNPEENNQYLELLSKTASQAVSVIHDLYDATLGSQHQEAFSLEKLSVIIRETVEVASIMAREKNIQLQFQEPLQEPRVLCLPRKISRVMSNLLNNAVKFTPGGGQINVRISYQEDKVLVEVQDSGIGIPPHMQADIFHLFTPFRRQGTNGEFSHGIGLSLCKQIIERHRGAIWFESVENKGTSFYFSLALNPVL